MLIGLSRKVELTMLTQIHGIKLQWWWLNRIANLQILIICWRHWIISSKVKSKMQNTVQALSSTKWKYWNQHQIYIPLVGKKNVSDVNDCSIQKSPCNCKEAQKNIKTLYHTLWSKQISILSDSIFATNWPLQPHI